MKAKSLLTLLTLIVIFLLPTAAQAAEYKEVDKEVNASDILIHIEKGDNINLDNCSIVGELDISKIKLETVQNQIVSPDTYDTDAPYELGGFDTTVYIGLREHNESLLLIESNILKLT